MLGKLQFGVYELDRDAMELRKCGVPLRLQEQPRNLAALVERPGEIVTREELRELIRGVFDEEVRCKPLALAADAVSYGI
jgi:DNA-binding response OmpR family regulator